MTTLIGQYTMYSLPTGIWAVIQARIGSTRLPGKALLDIEGKPMLQRVIERTNLAPLLNGVVVAIPEGDESLLRLTASLSIPCYLGSSLDVLDRTYQAATWVRATTVVRITADCPLIDWEVINGAIQFFLLGDYEYVTNRPSYPDGADIEVISIGALNRAWVTATSPYDREHVTPYIQSHPDDFRIGNMAYDIDISHIKLSVDTIEDLELVRQIYRELGEYCSLSDIINWLGVKQ